MRVRQCTKHQKLGAILSILTLVALGCGAPASPQATETPLLTSDSGWDDIPLYPGTNLGYGWPREMPFPGVGTVWTWNYETQAAPDQVIAFYLDEMPQHGWQETTRSESPLGATWQQQGGELEAEIGLSVQEGQTVVVLSRTARTAPGDSNPSPLSAQPDENSPLVPFRSLDSYRLVVTIKREGQQTAPDAETSTVTWVREPQAVHMVHPLGWDQDELIAIGDMVWDRTGETWTRTESESQARAAYTEAGELWARLILGPDTEIFWKEATQTGAETVNGLQCEHYLLESSDTVGRTTRRETWITQRDDLGYVPCRGRYELWHTDTLLVRIVVDVTGINAPLTIEAPN